jgi:7-cyano-7-deazaguanine tRNA-ribosyltransferase
VRGVRQAIREGRLWELAEERARVHPSLLSGFREIRKHADWLADESPRRWKGSFLYVGPDSLHRPEARLYRRRLMEEFDTRGRPEMLLLPRRTTPYTKHFGGLVKNLDWTKIIPAVETMFGPVPLELDETFPLAQCAEPDELEYEAAETAWNVLTEFSPKRGVSIRRFDEDRDGHLLSGTYSESDAFDTLRLKAVADMQFGRGAGEAMFSGHLRIVRSKNTGKIRNVYDGTDFVASMRAADGFLNLHLAGAERLIKRFPPAANRIMVKADSVEFNEKGKSVFAHFVTGIDPGLAAGDEVIVVGPGDRLVAVGELTLSPRELRFFKKGMAVKVREGAAQSNPGAEEDV